MSEYQKEECGLCGVTQVNVRLLKCGGCELAYYCCSLHQELDWIRRHQGFCTFIQIRRRKCGLEMSAKDGETLPRTGHESISDSSGYGSFVSSEGGGQSQPHLAAIGSSKSASPLVSSSTLTDQALCSSKSECSVTVSPKELSPSFKVSTNSPNFFLDQPDPSVDISEPDPFDTATTSETKTLGSEKVEASEKSNSGCVTSLSERQRTSVGGGLKRSRTSLQRLDQDRGECTTERLSLAETASPIQSVVRRESGPEEKVSKEPTECKAESDQAMDTIEAELRDGERIQTTLPPLLGNSLRTWDQAYAARIDQLSRYILFHIRQNGWAVLDHFLGKIHAACVRNELIALYQQGLFESGTLMKLREGVSVADVRSDQIFWFDKSQPSCRHATSTNLLITILDSVMCQLSVAIGNNICGRSRAMIACYPGNGTRYIRHVDNPNKDGRLLTCIYYSNVDWKPETDGGTLRLYPEASEHAVDIVPTYDRLLVFWSDSRTPHEVCPAFKHRFAITVWYFDGDEKKAAISRAAEKKASSDAAKGLTSASEAAFPTPASRKHQLHPMEPRRSGEKTSLSDSSFKIPLPEVKTTKEHDIPGKFTDVSGNSGTLEPHSAARITTLDHLTAKALSAESRVSCWVSTMTQSPEVSIAVPPVPAEESPESSDVLTIQIPSSGSVTQNLVSSSSMKRQDFRAESTGLQMRLPTSLSSASDRVCSTSLPETSVIHSKLDFTSLRSSEEPTSRTLHDFGPVKKVKRL